MNILFILFLPTSGWWPFARGPLGLTMWPLAASGGWPLARGQLHSDLVNARRMRPYMPGGRWRGGPYKRGTTVNPRNIISNIIMIFNINSTRGQTRFLTCVARVTCLVRNKRSTKLGAVFY